MVFSLCKSTNKIVAEELMHITGHFQIANFAAVKLHYPETSCCLNATSTRTHQFWNNLFSTQKLTTQQVDFTIDMVGEDRDFHIVWFF